VKRIEQLADLSRDHHQGLVIARKARRAATEGEFAVARSWTRISRRFEAELEPHFALEEEYLLPVLESGGMEQWAERVCSEHARLRALMGASADRTAANLLEFGELLECHIRFEERELFETAQDQIPPAAFDRLAAACLLHPRTCALED
jgi:hypothetical protein